MTTIIVLFIFLVIPILISLHYNKLENFIYFSILLFWLPITLPFKGLLVGMTIPESIIYTGFIYYLFLMPKSKKTKLGQHFNKPLIVGFTLFFVGAFFSIFNSINNSNLFLGLRQTIIFPIIFLFLFLKTIDTKEEIIKLFDMFFFSVIILIAVLYLHPKTQYFDLYRANEAGRLGGQYLFLNKYQATFYEATFATFLGFIYSVILILTITRGKKYYFFLLVFSIALILTAGRTGWVAALLSLLLVSSRYIFLTKRAIVSITVILIVLFLSYLIFSSTLKDNFLYANIINRVFSLENVTNAPNFIIRLYQWLWGLDVFSKNIWGIGFWNFEVITGGRFAGNSTWINMLLDVGFLGTIGFLVIYIYSVIRIFRVSFSGNYNIKVLGIGVSSSLLAVLLGGTTENIIQSTFYYNFSFWFFIAVANKLFEIDLKNNNYLMHLSES